MSSKAEEPVRRSIVDLYHVHTLSGVIGCAFHELAPRYGLRVEGIEDDVNEWSDFWHDVAKHILTKGAPPRV